MVSRAGNRVAADANLHRPKLEHLERPPPIPTRAARYMTGPGESRKTPIAMKNARGTAIGARKISATMSNARLAPEIEAAWVEINSY